MEPDTQLGEESQNTVEEQEELVDEPAQTERVKAKENVKFTTPNNTFTSEDGDSIPNEEHVKEAKKIATPAIFKRRQATRHLVVNSPTDHIFSPCSQKLLHKKRTEAPKEY